MDNVLFVKEEESVRAGREINKMICRCSRQKERPSLRACGTAKFSPLINKSDLHQHDMMHALHPHPSRLPLLLFPVLPLYEEILEEYLVRM